MSPGAPHEGGCMCAAVRYQVTGPLRDVVGCHCSQCRRMTGHFMAASAARLADFSILSDAAHPPRLRRSCGRDRQ